MYQTIVKKITDMATKSFYEDLDDFDHEKEQRWFAHWFKTAINFKENLEKEGLTETVRLVTQIISDQKRIVDRLTIH